MDVRSIATKPPVLERDGTIPLWWMIEPHEFKDMTDGGFLAFVNEFEVPGGGLVDPHSHPTHEFYYVLSGRGVMMVDGEDREVVQGDLIYIPPDKVHSLRPVSDHAPVHCFAFAFGLPGVADISHTKR
jgi:quercetin dioxygenase-like cupin family protein